MIDCVDNARCKNVVTQGVLNQVAIHTAEATVKDIVENASKLGWSVVVILAT